MPLFQDVDTVIYYLETRQAQFITIDAQNIVLVLSAPSPTIDNMISHLKINIKPVIYY